ncbi:MAG: Fic family protein [Bacteroidales bacterium]|nr:Fic family protein [Bacteroidales bacterium]
MRAIKYPTYADVMWLYDRVIEASDGGLKGFRDEGELLYVLDFVQNDMYFPDFLTKMTFLVHRVCHGHIFLDGNKRMGLAIGGLFLSINGIYKPSLDYLGRMEIVSYHIASGNIDEDLLKNLLADIIAGKDYNENLKLELYNAVLN